MHMTIHCQNLSTNPIIMALDFSFTIINPNFLTSKFQAWQKIQINKNKEGNL